MKLHLPTKQVITYLPKKELGKIFPLTDYKSVTQIINSAKPKNPWVKQAMRDPNSAFSKATRAGTAMHRAIDSGESKTAFEAACLHLFERDIMPDIDEVWGQEEWLAHKLGFKGKFDGVGIFRGRLTLFDFKKTNAKKTPKSMANWFTQLSAYSLAHSTLYPDHPIEQVAIFNVFGKTEADLGTKVSILNTAEVKEHLATFTAQING